MTKAEGNLKMHYVIGDVHNDNKKLRNMLKRISFGKQDHVYLLGDLFDRGGDGADPAGVYFTVLGLEGQCTVVRGNHDQWLADYIRYYEGLPRWDPEKCWPYLYNSHDLLRGRLPSADLLRLADVIYGFPLQAELELEHQKYLFAHVMTFPSGRMKKRDYYLMGDVGYERFAEEGFPGYVSFCGHTHTSEFFDFSGHYLDEANRSIWRNEKGSVHMMDCGCGYEGGRLACMCIESGERFYSDA